jgi:hypothetical protein
MLPPARPNLEQAVAEPVHERFTDRPAPLNLGDVRADLRAHIDGERFEPLPDRLVAERAAIEPALEGWFLPGSHILRLVYLKKYMRARRGRGSADVPLSAKWCSSLRSTTWSTTWT